MQKSVQSSFVPGSGVWVGVILLILVGSSPGSGSATSSTDPAISLPRQFSGPTETAVLAGGCFWCMEAAFEGLEGVVDVVSGYSGGKEANPTYAEVSSGRTSHTESIKVTFDPTTLSYARLLDYFWLTMNPTDGGGQFVDRGTQYRPEIFVNSEAQRAAADAAKLEMERSGPFAKPIVVPISDVSVFYPAEDYHQDYYRKSPEGYLRYERGSGREPFLVRVWGEHRFDSLRARPE